MASYTMLPQVEESLQHIIHHRNQYIQDAKFAGRPFIVGVSGCQGSGKTTLCDTLQHILTSEPYNLNVVSFSLDDFYLTRADQVRLAAANPDNPLLQKRGQAGSHDLELATRTLTSLVKANKEHSADRPVEVSIPSYDKSLHGGLGDRLDRPKWRKTYAPYDVILFEGWSQGFKPLQLEDLRRMYREACATGKNTVRGESRLPLFQLPHLEKLNDNLRAYEARLYSFFDIFVHLSPADPEQVFEWRLQQEHHMKATRGVDGMSDEDVRAFIDTYMPAYELYLPRLDRVGFYGQSLHSETLKPYEGLHRSDGGYSQPERHLRLVLDKDRRVIRSQRMKEPDNLTSTNDNGTATGQAGASSSGSNNSISPTSNPFRWLQARTTSRLLVSFSLFGLFGLIGFSRRRKLLDTALRYAKSTSQ